MSGKRLDIASPSGQVSLPDFRLRSNEGCVFALTS